MNSLTASAGVTPRNGGQCLAAGAGAGGGSALILPAVFPGLGTEGAAKHRSQAPLASTEILKRIRFPCEWKR